MLRSLLVLAFPVSTLLASVSPVGRPDPGDPGKTLGLVKIPFAAKAEAAEASELVQLRAVAEQGDREAQAKLGSMYYWGQGAPKDWPLARRWLGKASAQGHRDAQAKLGAMWFLGQGGPRSVTEALKWFEKAAAQGEPYAQGCIGVLYAVGEGVPRDLFKAYVYLLQANAGGDADAAEPLQQVKARLTEEQIREGFRQASEAVKKRAAD
jgi:uncharacterized protein